jgi:DNA-binding Lrp family transcriptional regulator
MRVRRSEQFIIRDFEFYDSGVLAAYGPMLFDLYELLRRYVWRSDTKGAKVQRQLWRDGQLATLVSQSELGEQLNVSRQTVSKYLREMKALGWVKTEDLGDRELAYVLGERLPTSDGQRHEVFYADAWMRSIWEGLEQEAKAEETTVRCLPIAHRIQFIRELAVVLSNELTGPVNEALQGVESQRDRPCKTSFTGGSESPTPSIENDSEIPGTEVAKNRRKEIQEEIGEPSGAALSPESFSVSDQSPPVPLPGSNKEDFSAADRKQRLQSSVAGTAARTDAARDAKKARREKRMREARTQESRSENLKGKGAARTPGIKAMEKAWHSEWVEAFPSLAVAKWKGKEFGQCKQLMEKYDAFLVRTAIQYIVSCWSNIRTRVFKGRGTAPTMGTLLRMHDTFFPEAQKWVELRDAKSNYDAWFAKNPNNPYPPEELEKRYQAAQEGLKALGLE